MPANLSFAETELIVGLKFRWCQWGPALVLGSVPKLCVLTGLFASLQLYGGSRIPWTSLGRYHLHRPPSG